MQHRMNAVGAAAKATQEQKHSGGSKSLLSDEDRFVFKPHASTDALRYDDAGRLWVRTLRGTGRTTVFDVFGPTGAFVGEVTLPVQASTYSLAGSYLATASERADGVPVVVLWSVR
jgi:sugar lactone lactonase YvrE